MRRDAGRRTVPVSPARALGPTGAALQLAGCQPHEVHSGRGPEVRPLLTRVQRPRVQECLDRGSPYWFFRYWEDQALPEGGRKTTRKRHILAPSQGRYALSRRQAETARDRFLARLQAPPPTPLASPAA